MKSRVLLRDDPADYVATTSLLSSFQVMNALPVVAIISTLNQHGIKFVLVGAHGLAHWRQEARATEDVAVIVMARHQKKAVRALLEAYPHLEADDQEVVIRLRDPSTKKVSVDVMKTNQPLFSVALKHCEPIQIEKKPCKIPSLEMALAMKFAPMISIVRADYKKYMDAADFIRIVNVNPEIDLTKLAELGELVYSGGGKEIVEKVRQVRAGEKLVL
jgi:hypothetical protein